MQAPIASQNHADWRARESARAAVCEDFDRRFDNLKACVHWLIANGISVVNADLRRHNPKPRVTVVASPLLHVLLKDDAASAGQHWDKLLGRTMHDWVAVRYEVEIRWEAAQ